MGVVGTKEGVASPISAMPEKKQRAIAPYFAICMYVRVPVHGCGQGKFAALRAVHINFFSRTTLNLLGIRPWLYQLKKL